MSVGYIEVAAKAIILHNEACVLVRKAIDEHGDLSMEAQLASEYTNITKANRDKVILENRRLAMKELEFIAITFFDNVKDLYDFIDFAKHGYFPVDAGKKG